MRQSDYDENLILGYVENTLSQDEKAIFEQLLVDDPELADLVNMLRQDRLLLCEMDQVTAPMELSEYVSSQLERELLLGPLPYKKTAKYPDRSTPQSRGQFRIMRFCAYGSLAAMFLVVVALMYHDTANQTLMDRVAKLDFNHKQTRESVVAMNRSSDDTLDIEALAATPILPKIQNNAVTASPSVTSSFQKVPPQSQTPSLAFMERDEMELQETTAESFRVDTDAIALQTETLIANNISADPIPPVITHRDLKAMSPTTAMLAGESAPTSFGTSAMLDQASADQVTSISSAPSARKDKTLIEGKSFQVAKAKEALGIPPEAHLMLGKKIATAKSFPNASAINSPLAVRVTRRALTAMRPKNDTQQSLNQQNAVCLIQSPNPDHTVVQINQWAIRNRVEIVPIPKPTPHKTEQRKPLHASNTQLRQVVTLNIQTKQIPVLIQWLNEHPKQQNSWLQPLPQSNAANNSLQRLQQELPLAPTLRLNPPNQKSQIQLMIIPSPLPPPSIKP